MVLKKLGEEYANVVYQNAELITHFESLVQNLLPFFLTRFQRETIIKTELYYAGFSLVGLANDVIIMKKKREHLTEEIINHTQKKELVLPYWWEVCSISLHSITSVQLLVEVISMVKKKRWFAIFMLELLKVIIRLYMLFKTRGAIMVKQSVPPRELLPNPALQSAQLAGPFHPEGPSTSSGKKRKTMLDVIEKERFSQADSYWTDYWNKQSYPIPRDHPDFFIKYIPSPPTFLSIFAELLYILRPLIYVMTIITYGKNKWKPWIYSLVIEMYCYYLFKKNKRMNKEESEEGSRRALAFLYYFARSPFFEKVLCPTVAKFPVPSMISSISTLSNFAKSIKETIHTYQQFFYYTST